MSKKNSRAFKDAVNDLKALVMPIKSEAMSLIAPEIISKLINIMDNSDNRAIGDLLFHHGKPWVSDGDALDKANIEKAADIVDMVSDITTKWPDKAKIWSDAWTHPPSDGTYKPVVAVNGSTTTIKAIPYKPEPPCHIGNIRVFEYQGLEFFGGADKDDGWEGGYKGKPFDVVVGPDSVIHAIAKLDGWRISKNVPTFVPLIFPDGGTPHVYKGFWTDLLADLLDRRPLRILHMCMGGHGRTGTMLAIMYGLTHDVNTVDEAVDIVRKSYCEKAVETESQMKYIGTVLDKPYNGDVKPRPFATGYTGQLQGGIWNDAA